MMQTNLHDCKFVYYFVALSKLDNQDVVQSLADGDIDTVTRKGLTPSIAPG